jgi:hypothetical protein
VRSKIKDKFADEKVSRQRKYQMRKAAKGLCTRCGLLPRFLNKALCQSHYIDSRLAALGLFSLSGRNPWDRRRRKLVMYASGVMHGAARNTTTRPLSWQQIAAVVERHFFADASPKWRGVKLEQYSRWLYRWDRRLRAGRTI